MSMKAFYPVVVQHFVTKDTLSVNIAEKGLTFEYNGGKVVHVYIDDEYKLQIKGNNDKLSVGVFAHTEIESIKDGLRIGNNYKVLKDKFIKDLISVIAVQKTESTVLLQNEGSDTKIYIDDKLSVVCNYMNITVCGQDGSIYTREPGTKGTLQIEHELGLLDKDIVIGRIYARELLTKYTEYFMPYFTSLEVEANHTQAWCKFTNTHLDLNINIKFTETVEGNKLNIILRDLITGELVYDEEINVTDIVFVEKQEQLIGSFRKYYKSELINKMITNIHKIHLFKDLESIKILKDKIKVNTKDKGYIDYYLEQEDKQYLLVNESKSVKIKL